MTTKNVCSYAGVTGKKAKSVEQLIESAISSGKTMRERVQQAVVGIAYHGQKHNDEASVVRWANELLQGMGNGINGATLVKFLTEEVGLIVGKVVTVDDKTGKEKKEDAFTEWKGAQFVQQNWENILSKPWWEAKQAAPFKGFNLIDALEDVLKKANNANKKAVSLLEQGKEEDAAKIEAPIELIRAVREAMGKKEAA